MEDFIEICEAELPDEEVEEEEIPELTLGDIPYAGKTLGEWTEDFTIMIPALPCTATEIFNCMVMLNNNYQICYNLYTKLVVLSSISESQYKSEKYKLVNAYNLKLKESGTKVKIAIDKIELIVHND